MRALGRILLLAGLVVGGASAAAMMLPVHLSGLAWLLGVGMIKLGFVSSAGLLAGGAVAQRIANRRRGRRAPDALRGETGAT